jgi:hypothetical protein
MLATGQMRHGNLTRGKYFAASRGVSRKKKIETSRLGQPLSNPFAQIVRQ